MTDNAKNSNMKNYILFTSIILCAVLLILFLSYTVTDKIISNIDKNKIILNNEYSKQIKTLQEKLKSNSDIADSKISFKLTSKVVQPVSSLSDSFNYTGFMPDKITVTYTMSVEEGLNFLDKRYRHLEGDKNWYIINNRVEEYNFNITGTVNTTKEICRELCKEFPLFANETCF